MKFNTMKHPQIKETGIKKFKDLSPEFIKRIELMFGEINIERDFWDDDLKTYFKLCYYNEETKSSSHWVIYLE